VSHGSFPRRRASPPPARVSRADQLLAPVAVPSHCFLNYVSMVRCPRRGSNHFPPLFSLSHFLHSICVAHIVPGAFVPSCLIKEVLFVEALLIGVRKMKKNAAYQANFKMLNWLVQPVLYFSIYKRACSEHITLNNLIFIFNSIFY
jgi:hypothetical protein